MSQLCARLRLRLEDGRATSESENAVAASEAELRLAKTFLPSPLAVCVRRHCTVAIFDKHYLKYIKPVSVYKCVLFLL